MTRYDKIESMEMIKESYTIKDTNSRSALPEHTLFADIETTGLQAERHMIYLIGTAYFTGENEAAITLYFAQNETEEADILSAFSRQCADFEAVCTYNGSTFDLPFLRKRCEKYRFPDPCSHMTSVDLYRIFKKRKQLLRLPGCRQKDIEQYLGIRRTDEMNGGELIDIYKKYAKHPEDAAHKLLILHNTDDIKGMLSILPMLTFERLSEVTLYSPSAETDPVTCRYILTAEMSLTLPGPVRYRTEEYYLILENHTARCAFVLHDDAVHYFWDNPKDYIYLLEEQRVIPKALARTIPKTKKRPAAYWECYERIPIKDPDRPAEAFLCGYLQKIIRGLFRSC